MKTYQRIINHIHRQIQQDILRVGEPIPSIRRLSELLSVSKNSVIRAYQELESQGIIQARPRRGFILAPAPPDPLAMTPRSVTLGATSLDIIGPAQRQAQVVFGSANPETDLPGRRTFYRQLSRLTRAEQHSTIHSHYQPPPGNLTLRRQIALRTHSGATELDPNELIITNGAQEALALALRCTTTPGDSVLVESPCFYGILQCIEALGLKVIEVPAHGSEGLQVELLAPLLQRWSVRVILLNPQANNPQGFIMSLENRQRLLQLARQYELTIIEDDVYGPLIPPAQRPPTFKALDPQRVILCGGLSKILDPDIRIGWVAAAGYFDQINYLKYVTTLATSGLLQQVAADWLGSRQYPRHIKQLHQRYRLRRNLFIESLRACMPTQVQWLAPEAGFLCWLTLPDYCDGDAIFQQAKQQGISLTPGSLFGSAEQFRHCIRLNFSVFSASETQLQGLNTLGILISQMIRH